MLKSIMEYFDKVSAERFGRWTSFLNRKMFFCLVALVMLTAVYLTAILLTLWIGGVDAMKGLGTELWSGFCLLYGSIVGTAVGGNVMEHREKTKRRTANPGTPTEPAAS